jgi:ring-1,2-phenylacetyl-CoA epoxidase subunit PaaC
VPDEDRLAFFRDQFAFRNVRLAERPNGDFAATIARLLLFSAWRLELLEALQSSRDSVLAAVAAKGVKEVRYHREYAARWFVTLAQGTRLSRARISAGLLDIWPYVAELGNLHPVEQALITQRVAVSPAAALREVLRVIDPVLTAADLPRPDTRTAGPIGGRSGRDGLHTEALGLMLDEMQSVARAHPLGRW